MAKQYAPHEVSSPKLSAALKRINSTTPNGWRIFVSVTPDGDGNLIAICPKTGENKSVYIGKTEVKK